MYWMVLQVKYNEDQQWNEIEQMLTQLPTRKRIFKKVMEEATIKAEGIAQNAFKLGAKAIRWYVIDICSWKVIEVS